MNERIKKHLILSAIKEGYETDDVSLWDCLTDCMELYNESVGRSRWWDNRFVVTRLNGVLLGYMSAQTTGVDSPWEKGWEFDLGSVCEDEKEVKMDKVVKYKPIKEK
jgi:hypothetical protein